MSELNAMFIRELEERYGDNLEMSSEVDAKFLEEIREIMGNVTFNVFVAYRELTFLYVRYTLDITPYRDIPPFLYGNENNPILYLISYLRGVLAGNIIDFYDDVIAESACIINNTLKNKAPYKGKLLSIIKNFTPVTQPEEKIVNLEVSICEFAEFMNYAIEFIEKQKFPPEATEFLIAHLIYFSYIGREDNEKWSEFSDYIVKVFNSLTNDSQRPDSFLNLNGYALFELYKSNDFLQRKNLRDANLWALAGYRFTQETMLKEFDDFREAIDREEYSEILLEKCKNYLISANNIHLGYVFLPWSLELRCIQQIQKILALYKMAEYKIKRFKD